MHSTYIIRPTPHCWTFTLFPFFSHYKNAEINILAPMSLCTWVNTSVGKYLGHLIAESKGKTIKYFDTYF